ncbi:spidroin-2 [Piliocolobus tephrosceles]|uniref:spidroin-2 n=1 Tax=Piliocolobus tephrosceles TaxID=591936 RepID=UPI001300F440|nr:spidroin-2 [Piliocolobus tephrosceles]
MGFFLTEDSREKEASTRRSRWARLSGPPGRATRRLPGTSSGPERTRSRATFSTWQRTEPEHAHVRPTRGGPATPRTDSPFASAAKRPALFAPRGVRGHERPRPRAPGSRARREGGASPRGRERPTAGRRGVRHNSGAAFPWRTERGAYGRRAAVGTSRAGPEPRERSSENRRESRAHPAHAWGLGPGSCEAGLAGPGPRGANGTAWVGRGPRGERPGRLFRGWAGGRPAEEGAAGAGGADSAPSGTGRFAAAGASAGLREPRWSGRGAARPHLPAGLTADGAGGRGCGVRAGCSGPQWRARARVAGATGPRQGPAGGRRGARGLGLGRDGAKEKRSSELAL